MADFPVDFPEDSPEALIPDTVLLATPVLGGALVAQYRMEVWHLGDANWVRWEVAAPDPLGVSYPGPGVFGVDTQSPAHVHRMRYM